MRRPSWVALAEDYLAMRRKLDFELKTEGEELLRFGRYVNGCGHRGPLTVDLALRWATLPAEIHRFYRARRLDVVRRFDPSKLLRGISRSFDTVVLPLLAGSITLGTDARRPCRGYHDILLVGKGRVVGL